MAEHIKDAIAGALVLFFLQRSFLSVGYSRYLDYSECCLPNWVSYFSGWPSHCNKKPGGVLMPTGFDRRKQRGGCF